MHSDLTLVIIARLLLAAVLGGIIGLERELRRKPAGLRTNMFICIGSALFTLLSEEVARRFGDPNPTRIASNLIPGIGFIGAGAIIRERGSVVGLTTAATVFVIASVGMAVGAGLYVTAVFAGLLILTALTALGWFEDRFGLKARPVTFRLTTGKEPDVLAQASKILREMKVGMSHIQIQHAGNELVVEFDAVVSHTQEHEVLSRLSKLDVVSEVLPLEGLRE